MEAAVKEIDIEVKKWTWMKISTRRSTYGIMTTIINKHEIAYPWLNRDKLNNYKRSMAHKKITHVLQSTDTASSLTPSSVGFETDNEMVFNANAPSIVYAHALAVWDAENDEVNQGGRPKGSTNENIREAKRAKKLALNYAASEASLIKQHSQSKGYEWIPKGKKNSIDYFKCKSLKRSYPLGASLHYLVLSD
jgi:hypothetical protein